MLYIVQAVIWGVAETPQLFLDEAKAQTAYVAWTQKQWDQRYSAYCEHHGVSRDDFASAQAFVNTIDASEKSTINIWALTPDETRLGDANNPPCGARAEAFQPVADELVAIKEGLTRLLSMVSNLGTHSAMMNASTEGQSDPGPVTTGVFSSVITPEKPSIDAEKHKTREWEAFVGTIRHLCCSRNNDFYLLPKDNWRQDVYSNRTSLEYWSWVADSILRLKGVAQNANYAVIDSGDSPGDYTFTDREGIASEECYASEWEAWCAAGLHVEGKSDAVD